MIFLASCIALTLGIVLGAVVSRTIGLREAFATQVFILNLRREYDAIIHAKDQTIRELVGELH
jgi:hypothetical protein